MPEKEPVAFNINFDSLNEAYGFPAGFRDSSFFEVFDRINTLAKKHDVPLSIFVIGRDLENPEIFSRVREWAQMGHEVGNHTWSHPFNFGSPAYTCVEDEIRRAHDLIADCTGLAPTGFIAPNWSFSRRAVSVLIDLGYEYDTSVFPSVILYALLAKCLLISRRSPARMFRLLSRSDWLFPLTRPVGPHFVDRSGKTADGPGPGSILVLPLPAPGRIRPACWHTLGFALGWDRLKKLASGMIESNAPFYYLMHPADFIGHGDLDSKYGHSLERMNVPLSEKLKHAEEMFDLVAGSGRPVVRMREVARRAVQAASR